MSRSQVMDLREKQAVKDELFTPVWGVTLHDGLLKDAFEHNIEYLKSLSVDSILYWFRTRGGEPAPGEPYRGHFEDNIKGQTAGLFLMGAANSLRWQKDEELREKVDTIVSWIDRCREPDGYLMAVPKREFGTREYPHYVRSWLTYGLLAAGLIGNDRAYPMLRSWQEWFNRCDDLPIIRYLLLAFQGIIASTNAYFSPIGTARDLEVAVAYYQEDWRLGQFIMRYEWAVHERIVHGHNNFPHGYELTAIEGYLDLYRATGKAYYLNAVEGAYALYQDQWQHLGGGIVMIENEEMFPGCYWLSPERKYNELCCSVFWVYLNQRLHRLFPLEERYVAEIEKSIYNVAVANQVGGAGIRYHAKLDRHKVQEAYGQVHCCEGQGTRLFGALPEFLYSLAADGLFVDLYAASEMTWRHQGNDVTLVTETDMPFDGKVKLTLAMAATTAFTLRLRIPSWVSAPVAIEINGESAHTGEPGSYLVVERTWRDGDTIAFELPMALRAHKYQGAEQVEGHERYGYEIGPVLLALVGELNYNDGMNTRLPHAPERPDAWLAAAEGPLRYQVSDMPGYTLVPYFGVGDEAFTCYPVFESR